MTTFPDDIKARLENGQIIFRRMTVVRLVADTIELEAALAAAQAENARLRAALEEVEFDDGGYCLWCGSYPYSHSKDCERQSALHPPSAT